MQSKEGIGIRNGKDKEICTNGMKRIVNVLDLTELIGQQDMTDTIGLGGSDTGAGISNQKCDYNQMNGGRGQGWW